MTRLARFIVKVTQSEDWDGCWRWVGAISDTGYGAFWTGKRLTQAHRWSYEHFVRPIPEGLFVDHLCRNRWCVRPDHLEPVTHAENMRRAAAFRTHCKQGHEFTPENTYVRKAGSPKAGSRMCRTCRREGMRRAVR